MKIKIHNLIIFLFSLNVLFGFNTIYAQSDEYKRINNNKDVFNELEARKTAINKGIPSSELEGYIQFLKQDFSSKKALEKQKHFHTPYETISSEFHETVIYLKPNQPQSIGCPNMGFEQYNFTGWTGTTGTVSTGGALPNYNQTGSAIVNTAGNNTSILNTLNYHTIMSLPPVNPIGPSVNGYDSLATRSISGQNVSQIPVVSPFSFDPVSVRMNGAVANYRGSRLKYITTTSSLNQRLSFSYAVVLHNPGGHTAGQSPYFKVEVRNEGTGAVLPGCTSYTFNPKTAVASDSLFTSSQMNAGEPVVYRKWQYYSVDLSNLPAGTNVSINFEVGGCSLSAHWGYAYVDAECGGVGTPYASMCSGSNFATLTAPTGFTSYQWRDPSNNIIPGATSPNYTVSPATPGSVYSVQMVSPGGCAVTQTVQIQLTTVSIININSTSSCAGGNSGSAYVQAAGSNGVYTYTWTRTSAPGAGTIVGNTQTVNGLASGNYSVVVASPSCGQASANLSVGTSPPFFSSLNRQFCGNVTFIPQAGGTNYTWYKGTNIIPAPLGTNDTLYINGAATGDVYTVVYNNSQGCKDSIRYNLSQTAGGSSYVNNIVNVCPGDINGSATINLTTTRPAPYTFQVFNSNNQIISNSTTSATNVPVSSLTAGSYTAIVNDGACLYSSPFTINPIQTNFTVTTTNTIICFPSDTAVFNLNFGGTPTAVCGTDPIICSSPANIDLFSAGPFTQNGTTNYPTPYGNWYSYSKHQFLVRQSDLNAAGVFAGKISSLAFNVIAMNNSISNYPNYTIKMGCTNLNAMPAPTAPFVSGLQTVYSVASQPVSTGWVTHNFNQAYVWDGVSNLIVEVCFGMNTSFNFSQNASVQLKQMTYNASLFYREDANPVCSGTQSGNNTGAMVNGAQMLPNMRFGYCGYSPPTTDYTLSVSPNGSIVSNSNNTTINVVPNFTSPPADNSTTIYTITALNPVGNCVGTQTIEVLYPALSNSISVSPIDTTICEGDMVQLNSSGGFYTNWYYIQNGTQIPLANTDTISFTPSVTGPNQYVVYGVSPCPNTLPDTKTVTVNVIPKADLYISPLLDATKCLSSEYVINTGVNSITPGNNAQPFSYNWIQLPGNTPAPGLNNTSSYTVSSSSTSTFVVTVNGNCVNPTSDTVVIKNFINNLSISILDSSSTCPNLPFTLNALSSGGYAPYSFSWLMDPSNEVLSNSTVLNTNSPSQQGEYIVGVYVNDSCGYTASAYQVITVLPPCSVEIPNVITPNGDLANESFKIKNIEFHPNTSLTIYDRWGKKVYESADYKNDWNASGSADGTYFYIVEVPDDKKYSGFITVFRQK
jgi:gliding motility-associated-like protein